MNFLAEGMAKIQGGEGGGEVVDFLVEVMAES